jgi:hypothetical protein
LGGRQMNEFDLMIFLNQENLSFQELILYEVMVLRWN